MNEEELTQYLTQIRVDHGLLIDDAGAMMLGDKVDDIEPQQQAATVLTDPQGSLTQVHRTDHQGSELLKKIAID
jgi:hypothetical protein